MWGGVQSSAQQGEASPTCGQEASEVLGTDKLSVQRQEVRPLLCGLFSEQVEVWSLGGSWGGSSCGRDREGGPAGVGEGVRLHVGQGQGDCFGSDPRNRQDKRS